MARRRNNQAINFNLDSFLDIITNFIGVLMVITILAMINAKYMTFIVRTPFVRQTAKSPVFFECRHQRNIPIDKTRIQTRLEEYVEGIKNKRSDYLRIMQANVPELHDVGDKFYRVNLTELFRQNVLVLVAKGNNQGEPAAESAAVEPHFRQALDRIDPQRQFAFFLVRPDSYEVFRKVRKILWDKNVEVGWEPLSADEPISFSTRGRKPTID